MPTLMSALPKLSMPAVMARHDQRQPSAWVHALQRNIAAVGHHSPTVDSSTSRIGEQPVPLLISDGHCF